MKIHLIINKKYMECKHLNNIKNITFITKKKVCWMDNKIPIWYIEKLAREWNKTKDIEEKKKLTKQCWFVRFYAERMLEN